MPPFEKQPRADEALDAKAERKLIIETPILDQRRTGVLGETLSQEAIDRYDKQIRDKILDEDSAIGRPIRGPIPPRAD